MQWKFVFIEILWLAIRWKHIEISAKFNYDAKAKPLGYVVNRLRANFILG